MEIVSLFGAMINYDKGLSKVTKLIYDTFKELGVTINEINLGYSSLPYFDGIKSQSVDSIIKGIRKSEGVILATTASFSTCSSILQNFFEHLELEEYKDVFKNKNCLLIVLSTEEKSFLPINNLSNIINNLGGYDSTRILIDTNYIEQFNNNSDLSEIIERQVEDFYRIVRQKRSFYIPSKSLYKGSPLPLNKPVLSHEVNIEKPLKSPSQPKQNIYRNTATNSTLSNSPVNNSITSTNSNTANTASYNTSAINNFNNKQNEDIKEITQFFSQKYKDLSSTSKLDDITPALQPLIPAMPEVTQKKTCRQLTASLIHFYQPQYAGNLVATIQITVSGNEEFNGYIKIDNLDCNYFDGIAPEPDMSIISSDKIWVNVVTGIVTAQKAFMTGTLKVKGNFVLLTKFDQIFNTSKNSL